LYRPRRGRGQSNVRPSFDIDVRSFNVERTVHRDNNEFLVRETKENGLGHFDGIMAEKKAMLG